MKISKVRFKWKPPFKNPPNKIWMFFKDRKPIFKFEIGSEEELIQIQDEKLINLLKEKLKTFKVCGAKNKGIILGTITIELPGFTELVEGKKEVIVMSVLKDWKQYYFSKHR